MREARSTPLNSGRWSHESEVHGVTEWGANRDFSKPETCTICGGHYYPARVSHESTWIGGINLPMWYHVVSIGAIVFGLGVGRPWGFLAILMAGGPLCIFLARRSQHLREIKKHFGIHRDFFEDPGVPTPGTRVHSVQKPRREYP